jgi:hypothetical protein
MDLVRLAQGLYFIFWGLLLAVIVGAQIVIVLWLRTFAELFLGAGVLAVLAGSWRLRQVRLDVGWQASARRTLGWALLTTYFCVVFYMWRQAPLQPYLQANALGFVGCGIGYLISLSSTLAALNHGLGRPDLAREARWFGGVTMTLMLGPFVAALGYVSVMAIRYGENPLLEFQEVLSRISGPVMLVLLLPLSLTLGMVWAAKDATLRRLTECDTNRPA